jgi:hypothetical protein
LQLHPVMSLWRGLGQLPRMAHCYKAVILCHMWIRQSAAACSAGWGSCQQRCAAERFCRYCVLHVDVSVLHHGTVYCMLMCLSSIIAGVTSCQQKFVPEFTFLLLYLLYFAEFVHITAGTCACLKCACNLANMPQLPHT